MSGPGKKEKTKTIETGQRCGYLTVLRELERKNQHRRWLCRCDCGKETVVEESHLKNGHTKSCGCYRKRKPRETFLDLTGQRYGRLLVLSSAGGQGRQGDYWNCRCDCGRICVCHKERLRSGNTKSCGCLREEQRKKNMEKAIHFVEGTCVEKIASRKNNANNTSGFRGVYRRENNRWRASIGFQGKSYNLGSFDSYEEAVNARLEAERELYDPFIERHRSGQTPTIRPDAGNTGL